jgi:predicted membrane metal-binding protein
VLRGLVETFALTAGAVITFDFVVAFLAGFAIFFAFFAGFFAIRFSPKYNWYVSTVCLYRTPSGQFSPVLVRTTSEQIPSTMHDQCPVRDPYFSGVF